MSPAQMLRDLGPRKVAMVATTVTAVLTAIIATMHFGEIAEPYWVATRGQVRYELQKINDKADAQTHALISQLTDTQLDIKKNERARINDKIREQQLLLQQNPTMPDPVKAAMNGQIMVWQDDIRNLDFSIEQLMRARSGQRP